MARLIVVELGSEVVRGCRDFNGPDKNDCISQALKLGACFKPVSMQVIRHGSVVEVFCMI